MSMRHIAAHRNGVVEFRHNTGLSTQLRSDGKKFVMDPIEKVDCDRATVGSSQGGGKLAVKTDGGAASNSNTGWDGNFAAFGNTDTVDGNGKHVGGCVGIGWNNQYGYGEIQSISPLLAWHPLNVSAHSFTVNTASGSSFAVTNSGVKIKKDLICYGADGEFSVDVGQSHNPMKRIFSQEVHTDQLVVGNRHRPYAAGDGDAHLVIKPPNENPLDNSGGNASHIHFYGTFYGTNAKSNIAYKVVSLPSIPTPGTYSAYTLDYFNSLPIYREGTTSTYDLSSIENMTDGLAWPTLDAKGLIVDMKIVAPSSGTMYLRYQSDDGSRIWIDQTELAPKASDGNPYTLMWGNHSLETAYADFSIVAGTEYRLRFQYVEASSAAAAKLEWTTSARVPSAGQMPYTSDFTTLAIFPQTNYDPTVRKCGEILSDYNNQAEEKTTVGDISGGLFYRGARMQFKVTGKNEFPSDDATAVEGGGGTFSSLETQLELTPYWAKFTPIVLAPYVGATHYVNTIPKNEADQTSFKKDIFDFLILSGGAIGTSYEMDENDVSVMEIALAEFLGETQYPLDDHTKEIGQVHEFYYVNKEAGADKVRYWNKIGFILYKHTLTPPSQYNPIQTLAVYTAFVWFISRVSTPLGYSPDASYDP